MNLFTKRWWIAARDRAARSVSQTFLLFSPAAMWGWMDVDWRLMLYALPGAALMSLANSILYPPPESSDVA